MLFLGASIFWLTGCAELTLERKTVARLRRPVKMRNVKLITRMAETAGFHANLLLQHLSRNMASPRVCCILGPPAAGKGTLAKFLSRWTGMPVIGVGELLRGNALGSKQQEEKNLVSSGELLPDGFITQLVARELAQHGQRGAILDGYPRTLAQAHALSEIADVQQVLNLRMPDEALVEKSLARRACSRCGSVFSMRSVSLPATADSEALHLPAILPSPGCLPHLTTRDDDTPAAVLRRLEVHKQQAAPIEAFFRSAGLLEDVHISGGVEHMRGVLARVMRMAPVRQQQQEAAELHAVFA